MGLDIRRILVGVIFTLVVGVIIDATFPVILQEVSLDIHIANADGFGYVGPILVLIVFGFVFIDLSIHLKDLR